MSGSGCVDGPRIWPGKGPECVVFQAQCKRSCLFNWPDTRLDDRGKAFSLSE